MVQIMFKRASEGKLWDKLVGWWTGGPYSHTEMRFSDGMCFSSSPRDGGTRFKKIAFDPFGWDSVDVPCSKEQEEKMRKWCESKVGYKYDWLGVLGFVLLSNIHDKTRYYCSEINMDTLEVAGLFDWGDKRISPTDMWFFIRDGIVR